MLVAEELMDSAKYHSPNSLLQPIQDLARNDMVLVNEYILDMLQSDVGLIPELAQYILSAGGKRLRPMLTIAAAKLCGYNGDKHINLACSVEFIHTATLLHDDVVDNSALRRGMATANNLWDNKSSILVGDFLFSRAFQLMVKTESLEVLSILSDASAVIAEGEVAQMAAIGKTSLSRDEYFAIIGSKTAKLIEAACEVAGVIANNKDQQKHLLDFGYNLGMAFQIIDDILDYSSDSSKMGKNPGDDLREGKITLPVILAQQFAKEQQDNKQIDFWQNIIRQATEYNNQTDTNNSQERQISNPQIDIACDYLENTGALAASKQQAYDFVSQAKQALENGFANEKENGSTAYIALEACANFCLARMY